MTLYRLKMLGLAGVLSVGLTGLAACEAGPTEGPPVTEAEDEVAPTAGVADYGLYDNDVDTFLTDYIREDEMFADDDLEYEVNEGVVTVTGSLDSEAERDALIRRIRAVPAVRDVNVESVVIG